MFWTLVSPLEITLLGLVALITIATLVAPKFKWKRWKVLLVSVVVAFVAFVPTCVGVMLLMDMQRFGLFQYKHSSEIQEPIIRQWLPPTATAITVVKGPEGFRARYAVSQADLAAYLDDLWMREGKYSDVKRDKLGSVSGMNHEFYQTMFGDLGWPPLEDAMEYYGPIAKNGAGFQVWYSAKTGIAYEYAGYW